MAQDPRVGRDIDLKDTSNEPRSPQEAGLGQAPTADTGRRQQRSFVLGSLSLGHGISHLMDQSFPLLMTEVAEAMGLGTLQKASLFAVRQVGSSVTSLGGGPIVDRLKRRWGTILTLCMVWASLAYAFVGVSPNFVVLIVAISLVSIPGSLWHLPATAAVSQRFPDRRGFAVSMHGFGANIGNALSPVVAGALLGIVVWNQVYYIYSAPALLMALFVWWALRNVGIDGGREQVQALSARFRGVGTLLRNPVVLGLIAAALLRGIGLNALFNWTPFYLKEDLGMGSFEAGAYYALLTGLGIVSAPILGALSDRVGRKQVLVPGFAAAAALSMLVVSTGDSVWLLVVLAGLGLFSFALHQIILAALLDLAGQGEAATATGLLFGINGLLGSVSPFLAFVIIDYLGGNGSIFYYSGILTAATAVIILVLPLARTPAAGRA